jgi:hypothetical protein
MGETQTALKPATKAERGSLFGCGAGIDKDKWESMDDSQRRNFTDAYTSVGAPQRFYFLFLFLFL